MRRFEWTSRAKDELRQIEREQAVRILLELTRFAESGRGDVKQLQASDQFRLRVGDYRVRFKVLDSYRN